MTSLSGIIPEVTRKAEHAAAVAAADPTAEAAAAQVSIQEHYCRLIMAWTAKVSADPGAQEDECKFLESLITDAGLLTTWQTDLEAAGYVVDRADDYFRIGFTA